MDKCILLLCVTDNSDLIRMGNLQKLAILLIFPLKCKLKVFISEAFSKCFKQITTTSVFVEK